MSTFDENPERVNNSDESPTKRMKLSNCPVNVTKLAISDLPYDVLEKILEFVVGSSNDAGFLNASTVCNKWNEVISSSAWIMHRLRPKVLFENLEDDHRFHLTRKYRLILLMGDFSFDPSPSQLQVMSSISALEIADQLQQVTFNNFVLTLVHFNALQSLKNLRSLSFYYCLDADIGDNKPIELNKLRNLTVKYSNRTSILDWIKCKELDSFTYDLWSHNGEDDIDSSIVSFLNQLERLDALHLPNSGCWISDVELKPKFLWSKLELKIPCDNAPSTEATGIKALCQASKDNAESIITIEMYHFENASDVNRLWSSNWLDFLNICLPTIKSLTIDDYVEGVVGEIDENLIISLLVMNSVEKLIVCQTHGTI